MDENVLLPNIFVYRINTKPRKNYGGVIGSYKVPEEKFDYWL